MRTTDPTERSSNTTALVSLQINGEERSVAVEPRRVLLDVIRDDVGLTGTKQVCEMGNCGACTVLLDNEAVYSCLVLGVECDGRSVETVESLADGPDLHPIQAAFADCDAFQCGFCTPGQMMSIEALRRRRAAADEPGDLDADIGSSLAGNLCRCGAYRHILDAARMALGDDR
ncbi:MAG: (2Fe-2S)-binding protein [Ilumatobacteraceae bacterium]|nr:(2Fe-2S)-binding protein [Ilumatobacteraceae bacterium]